MKNIKTLLLTLAVLAISTTCVDAATSVNVKEQKAINQKTATVVKSNLEADDLSFYNKFEQLSTRYLNNFRECEPIHISQSIDLFGLKISYKIDVNGWQDNKCGYMLTGKIGGIGKDIREVFDIKISDEEIAKFEPIIKCDFTKEQLNILVDAIIANYNKKATIMSELLQDPTEKYTAASDKNKLTPEEEKLVKMIAGGKACSIENMNTLLQNFNSTTQMQPAAPSTSQSNNKKHEKTNNVINKPQLVE